MTDYRYRAFGYDVDSEVELPRLAVVSRDTSTERTATVRIERGPLPSSPADLPPEAARVRSPPSGCEAYVSGQTHFWFHDSDSRLRVRGGEVVTISSEGTPGRSLRALIRGPGFGSVCVQRERVALHASAVAVDGAAVAFCGPSGRGKSTAAAACYARGHEVVTDDLMSVAPRDGAAVVSPGVPTVAVDSSVVDRLGLCTGRQDGHGSTARVDASDRFVAGPSRLERVYLIEDGEDVAVEQLTPPEQTFVLLDASLALYPEAEWSAVDTHLSVCGRVGELTTVKRLVRPRSMARLSEVVSVVEADVTAG